MLRVGLTGGIGSGKSTAARLFAERGVPVIDTDLIARELVEPNRPALKQIVERFGKEVIGANGRLDRGSLRARIFADAGARADLEAILHPLILAETQQRAQLVDAPYVLLVIPLLVEKEWQTHVDRVLVIDAAEERQLARTIERDHADPALAKAMLEAQASREQRRAAADDLIDNDGGPEALEAQVAELHRRYLELSNPSRPH